MRIHFLMVVGLLLLSGCSDVTYPKNPSLYEGIYDTVVRRSAAPCRESLVDGVTEVRHAAPSIAMTVIHDFVRYHGAVNPDGTFEGQERSDFGGTGDFRTLNVTFYAKGFVGVLEQRVSTPWWEPVVTCSDTLRLEGTRR
jgi:hypothetical protein